MKEREIHDKKKVIRAVEHPTVPPRLEGVVKNAGIKPVKKKKKKRAE